MSDGGEELFRARAIRRGAWLLSLALGVTLVTRLAVGEGFVVFGALHLIGLSTLLACPLLHLRRKNLAMGLLMILAGSYIQGISVGHPWLLWLGLAPSGFSSIDYLPVLPWSGFILVGASIGDILYRDGRRRISLPDLSGSAIVRPFTLLGRRSLMVYLVHQPILLSLLYIFGIRPL
ncbi:MAG: heparan-alpha-glucosaminide N-acetyltransferase [Methanothrix sp.]|nr:heparan-alpha-glucosaminide N-acetyltransferase [Methanothrix sp.]